MIVNLLSPQNTEKRKWRDIQNPVIYLRWIILQKELKDFNLLKKLHLRCLAGVFNFVIFPEVFSGDYLS